VKAKNRAIYRGDMAGPEDKHTRRPTSPPTLRWPGTWCQRRRFTAVGHATTRTHERWSESCRRPWPPNYVNVSGSQE
jgi:hypothetical protein